MLASPAISKTEDRGYDDQILDELVDQKGLHSEKEKRSQFDFYVVEVVLTSPDWSAAFAVGL